MRRLAFLIALALFAAPLSASAQPASWPADSAYVPAFCAGASTNDKVGDAPAGKDERDIVGDTTHPAFFTTDDGTYAFFRVRVDADPVVSKGGNAPLSQFGWGVGMDTDNDTKTIEYAWVVNGITEVVNLTNNKDKKNALKVWSPTLDKSKAGPDGQTFLPVYVEVKKAADGSKFNKNDDYFITVAMHMQQAVDATKGDKNPIEWGKVRLWVSTSANGFTLDKDFMCWDEAAGIVDLSKAVGDPIVLGAYVDITAAATADSTTPTVTGTTKPGAKVTVKINGKSTVVTADSKGVWTLKVPESWGLADGKTYDVEASVTDNGKTATATAKLKVVLPPEVKLTSPVSSTSGVTTSTQPTVAGTALPGAKVTVEINGHKGTATADKDGKWTYAVPKDAKLEDGKTYDVKVSASKDGKTATDSAKIAVQVPAAVALTGPKSGTTSSTDTLEPTLKGTANPGATVTVKVGTHTATVVADKDGKWTYTVPASAKLADNTTYDVSVSVTRYGKTATDTAKLATDLPATLTLDKPAKPEPTATPKITGTAKAGATVTVSIGSNSGTATADKDGKWSFDVPLAWALKAGDKTKVKATTPDGSKTLTKEADLEIAASTTVSLSDKDAKVTTLTPTVSGKATPGAAVIVELGGVKLTTVADKDGNWSVAVPPAAGLADGKSTDVKVTATAGGKTATAQGKISVSLPAFVTFVNPPSGLTATVLTTEPTFAGTARPGAKVTVEINGHKGTATADKDGKWTYAAPKDAKLEDGKTYTVKASTTKDGKTASDSVIVTVAVPKGPSVALSSADATVDSATPTVTGTATPGAQITVDINGKKLTTTADKDGKWSVTVPKDAGLADGKTYDVKVSADKDGKSADATGKLNVSLPLSVSLSADSTQTASTTPTLTGTATPGATVTVTIDGQSGTATADKHGKWSFNVPASWKLSAGKSYAVTLKADKDGKSASGTGDLAIAAAAPSCTDGTKNGDETDVDCGGSCKATCANGKGCKQGGDCDSGACNAKAGVCAPPPSTCANGKKDGDETDVDCGGSCAAKCADGEGCNKGGDCVSALCDDKAKTCLPPPSCTDGKKNGDETDVDCGGPCPTGCKLGKGCKLDLDCDIGLCDGTTSACTLPATCTDTKLNGLESDVDCGGGCAKCDDGKKCLAPDDCKSASCDESVQPAVCKPGAGCNDGKKNGDETDVDCGGSCNTKCATGKGCATPGDCVSDTCDEQAKTPVCVEPANCTNGKKDANETDVDCGGACVDMCDLGEGCVDAGDCVSAQCDAKTKVCVQSDLCGNGKLDGDETDVDCGGSCPKTCDKGQGCKAGTDCTSKVCDTAAQTPVCADPPSCTDGAKNGDETDVDCGGSCKDGCKADKGCAKDDDCETGLTCADDGKGTLVCTAKPDCSDGVQNGDETDVDCGGSCGDTCVDGKGCTKDDDCKSNTCDTGASPAVCAPGPSCADGVKNGDETDVDCGGSCSNKCDTGKSCSKGSDCASDSCDSGTCTAPKSACPDPKADPEDCDGDGLKNSEEDVNNNGKVDEGETDPLQADTDKDGVTDGQEKLQGSDPTAADLKLSGGGCSAGSGPGSGSGWLWALALAGLALLGRRRRRGVEVSR